jgi:hypothetical protein
MRGRRLRWVLMLAGLAVLVAAVALMVFFFQPSLHTPQITPENIARIERGMTMADVERILGAPPGDYTTMDKSGPWRIDDRGISTVNGQQSRPETWDGDGLSVTVLFDPLTFRVTGRTVIHSQCVDNGPFEKELRRARRQWRRWFP